MVIPEGGVLHNHVYRRRAVILTQEFVALCNVFLLNKSVIVDTRLGTELQSLGEMVGRCTSQNLVQNTHCLLWNRFQAYITTGLLRRGMWATTSIKRGIRTSNLTQIQRDRVIPLAMARSSISGDELGAITRRRQTGVARRWKRRIR